MLRFLACDAFVRTNRRTIAVMFRLSVSLSVCLSVWDGPAL